MKGAKVKGAKGASRLFDFFRQGRIASAPDERNPIDGAVAKRP